MTWDRTWIDGPVQIPIYGPEVLDEEAGITIRPITGWRDGYRLNVRRDRMPEAATAFEVTPEPTTPLRTYAGDVRGEDGRWRDTAFLRFTDEAEAISVMGSTPPDLEPGA